MAIKDDISVAANWDIRYTWTTANYTVIEFHRYVQDLADDAVSSGDDLLDITDTNPSERSTDNIISVIAPYNIDDTLAEHLYDGSIIQSGWDIIYDGIVNFWVQGIAIDVIQNGALVTDFWGTGLNADSNAGISHRFMVKVRDLGADIDWRRLLGLSRVFGKTFSEFPINGTARWNNVLALTNADDLNNQTVEWTVATWTGITNIEWYRALDINNDWIDEPYYSEWNKDTYSINDLFERAKYLTRSWETTAIYWIEWQIFRWVTHEIEIDTNTGIFNDVEPVSWGTGTWQMLAIDNVSAGIKMYIQLLTGIAPVDWNTITGGTSWATADVDIIVTEKTIKSPFLWVSTGSAIIGNYGVGIEWTDLTANDKLTDLDGILRIPPNYVTFTVSGIVSWEDRVLVWPEEGGALKENQLIIDWIHTAWSTDITVTTDIPTDTPSSWTIRVFNWDTFERLEYTSYTGKVFTLNWTTPNDIADSANCYISYIDVLASAVSENFVSVFLADRALFIRVRDGWVSPIKQFESPATLGSAWGWASVIRTSDL